MKIIMSKREKVYLAAVLALIIVWVERKNFVDYSQGFFSSYKATVERHANSGQRR